MPLHTSRLLYWLLALAVMVNFTGLFTPIMGPDAARYAAIAKTMALSNNYLELFDARADWLDKPHFPFWITAAFFEVFGIKIWVYKLPGILFLLMGAWYTYLVGKTFYNRAVGLWAALMLLTTLHIIISNNDVRAEPFLIGAITASVYHYYRTWRRAGFMHLLAGSLFLAIAIMTKGIYAIVPVGGAIALHLVAKGCTRDIFQSRWLVAVLFTLVFITPELYALYYQFDLHPEKVVFGQQGVSGLKFFFWDSQFGRFFNSGPIKGEGDPLFFVHTTAWAYLPWVFLLVAAVVFIVRRAGRHSQPEWLSVGGSVFTFILFSASSFQLPHYIVIIFPFFSLLVAGYFQRLTDRATLKRLQATQLIVSFLLLAVMVVVIILFKPQLSIASIVLLAAMIIASPFVFSTVREKKEGILVVGATTGMVTGLFLNLVFYPSLLKYQGDSEAAFWLNKQNKDLPVAAPTANFALEFHLHKHLHLLDVATDAPPPGPYWLVADAKSLDTLQHRYRRVEVVKKFADYPITMIDAAFLNASTRGGQLRKTIVARVQP